MIGGRNAVRTTYRGYELIVDANDILAIAPDGDTFCAPSMSSIRSWVKKHSRSAGGNQTPSPNGVDVHTLSPYASSHPPNTITPTT